MSGSGVEARFKVCQAVVVEERIGLVGDAYGGSVGRIDRGGGRGRTVRRQIWNKLVRRILYQTKS